MVEMIEIFELRAVAEVDEIWRGSLCEIKLEHSHNLLIKLKNDYKVHHYNLFELVKLKINELLPKTT